MGSDNNNNSIATIKIIPVANTLCSPDYRPNDLRKIASFDCLDNPIGQTQCLYFAVEAVEAQ